MKATVDSDLCTGCGPCEEICPEVFEIIDDVAMVRISEIPQEIQDECEAAADSCPSEAISVE